MHYQLNQMEILYVRTGETYHKQEAIYVDGAAVLTSRSEQLLLCLRQAHLRTHQNRWFMPMAPGRPFKSFPLIVR